MAIVDKKSAKYERLLRASVSGTVTVGIHTEEGGQESAAEGLSNVGLAEQHVFGLGVPMRDFVRPWADRNLRKNRELIKAELQRSMVKGEPVSTAGKRIALAFEGSMKSEFHLLPELADSTKRRKGSSTPLVDTGVLRASVRGRYND